MGTLYYIPAGMLVWRSMTASLTLPHWPEGPRWEIVRSSRPVHYRDVDYLGCRHARGITFLYFRLPVAASPYTTLAVNAGHVGQANA